eukprot:CAMPEP_0201545804 /NCGR_PEP_ID=MMETSP0173_2-20130828/2231_1 /ASSEMBLY_ACC=CAM_ASM_000268 /TAXON_ID=218659 /ORGANISM="Vexillifera sp., Strain DIVA3 564/2" /LENGTH=148 /DNA_ID=CAMNT_0047954309 /DNA_START=43 /DNA_END=485 /DNA_ORIENTATION=+
MNNCETQSNSSSFGNKLQLLQEAGFTRRPQNIRLLRRFQGDVNQVIVFLTEKRNKQTKKQAKKQAKKEAKNNISPQMEKQLLQLEEAGFGKPRHRNIRLLRRFQGDVNQVIDFLTEKRNKQANKQAKNNNISPQMEKQLLQLEEAGFG